MRMLCSQTVKGCDPANAPTRAVTRCDICGLRLIQSPATAVIFDPTSRTSTSLAMCPFYSPMKVENRPFCILYPYVASTGPSCAPNPKGTPQVSHNWTLWVQRSAAGTFRRGETVNGRALGQSFGSSLRPNSWGVGDDGGPLVNSHSLRTGKSPCFIDNSTISMAIFNSYVKNYRRVTCFICWILENFTTVHGGLYVCLYTN